MEEGFMRGTYMMQFIPLHRTSSEASPSIWEWVCSWEPWETEFLEPEGWFEKCHDISRGSSNDSGLWYPHMTQGVYV
eukprot:7817404-Ditylum_brightwellii.AAC.1